MAGSSNPTPLQNKRYSRSDFLGAFSLPESPSDGSRDGRYNPARGVISPLESARGNYYSSMPSSAATTVSSSQTPVTPGNRSAHSPAVRHNPNRSISNDIMDVGSVRQDCVRIIGSEGQTRVVNISGCINAQQVYKAALKKFGHTDDWSNYCVYITTSDDKAVRLTDAELMHLVQDVTRPERSRIILRKKSSPLTQEDFRRALAIAREQQEQAGINLAAAGNSRVNQLISNEVNPRTKKRESRDPTKKITAFFGQRPPSELISSNLAEYFPGQEDGVLERTVRNSIRRSTRMSRYQSRLSVATTRSYASSINEPLPPVPSVADTWLKEGATLSSLRRPLSVATRRSILPSTAYDPNQKDLGLSPLTEESPMVGRKPFFPDPESPNVVVTDTDSINFDGTQTPLTDMGDAGISFLNPDGYDEGSEEEEDGDFDDDGEGISWIQGTLIGSGSFGSVYLALNSFTGGLMAVKQVEIPSSSGAQEARKQSMVDALQHEISLLKEMQHPNIVQYLGSVSEANKLNIFLEYVPGGSVATMLKTYGPLQEPLIRKFVREILNGLSYLHGKDIIHRDIKGANVLVDNMGNIKISDFGISKKVDTHLLSNASHRPSLQGSVFWMAPEVVKQTSYTRKADIWSLGCLIVEMFTGSHPYPDCSQLQAIFRIGTRSAAPEIPEKASEEAKEFLGRTFELDHEKRPSADELLGSNFIRPIVG